MNESMDNRILSISVLICLLACIASAGGLLINDLYRDSDLIKVAWRANDWITLVLVVPMMVLSILFTIKGGVKARVIRLGLLLYILYNYAFYLFGAVFNSFFLVYVALFALSIYALLIELYAIDAAEIKYIFLLHGTRKVICIFLLFIALPLAMVEGAQCVEFIVSGTEPKVPPLIFALDFSFVIPNCILGAVLLWTQNAWGYILSAMMLIKAFTYGLVLILTTALVNISGRGELDPLMPFYIFIALGGGLLCWILLKRRMSI